MSNFKRYTREQRVRIGKQYTKKERASYHKGKRYGFLCGVHAPKRK